MPEPQNDVHIENADKSKSIPLLEGSVLEESDHLIAIEFCNIEFQVHGSFGISDISESRQMILV